MRLTRNWPTGCSEWLPNLKRRSHGTDAPARLELGGEPTTRAPASAASSVSVLRTSLFSPSLCSGDRETEPRQGVLADAGASGRLRDVDASGSIGTDEHLSGSGSTAAPLFGGARARSEQAAQGRALTIAFQQTFAARPSRRTRREQRPNS